MEDLPYECLYLIFNKLNAKDIISLRKTCTTFREVVKYVKCPKDEVKAYKLEDIYWKGELIYGFTKYNLKSFYFPNGLFGRDVNITTEEQEDLNKFNGINSLTLSSIINNVYTLRDIKELMLNNYNGKEIILHENNKLEKLTVKSNTLKTITNGELLTHLTVNKISDVSLFKNLTFLKIEGNMDIEEVSNLPNLVNLYARSSFLKRIYNLDNIKFIECPFSSVNYINNVPKLKRLIACRTFISDVSNLTNLTYLNLSECYNRNITGIHELSKLKYLDVRCTYFVNTFKGLGHIETILCSGNVRDIDQLTETKNLYLNDYNYNNISGLTKLERLDIRNGNVTNISNCPNVKYIKVYYFKGEVICNLPNLETLYIFSRTLEKVHSLPKLKDLTLFYFKGRILQDIPNLETLNLSFTSLEIIKSFPKLKTLHLLNNFNLWLVSIDSRLTEVESIGNKLLKEEYFSMIPKLSFR